MNKKDLANQKRMAKIVADRVQTYKQAFSTKAGKAVLLDLMREHYMLQPAYQGREDAIGIAFRDGQRQVILRILTTMEYDASELYILLKQGEEDALKKNSQ